MPETPIHFLLHCKTYNTFRTDFLKQIEASCQQPHSRKEDDTCRSVTCFFQTPRRSEPWTPEEKVDKAALDFVLKAHKKRSADLETKFGLVENLTLPQASQPSNPRPDGAQATITLHFVHSVHSHPNTNTPHIARPLRPVPVRKGSGSHRQSSTESPLRADLCLSRDSLSLEISHSISLS